MDFQRRWIRRTPNLLQGSLRQRSDVGRAATLPRGSVKTDVGIIDVFVFDHFDICGVISAWGLFV
jgi:hypothetical protein